MELPGDLVEGIAVFELFMTGVVTAQHCHAD
jgi:hypothetical protein